MSDSNRALRADAAGLSAAPHPAIPRHTAASMVSCRLQPASLERTRMLRRTDCVTMIASDLRAVHHATSGRIERVAAMHRAAVVPEHEIADSPPVPPDERLARGPRPDVGEQAVGFRQR